MNIDVTNIRLHLKGNKKCKVKLMAPESDKVMLKHNHKAEVAFEVIPLE